MDKFPSIPKLSIQQPFSKIIEKATSLFNISTDVKVPALDGEIVYSKNNVCVHQVGGEERVPGYLSLRCSITEMPGKQTDSTLILHWVPNMTIRRNPKSVDSPVRTPPRASSATNLIDFDSDTENTSTSQSTSLSASLTNHSAHSCKQITKDETLTQEHSDENLYELSVKYVPSQSSSNSDNMEGSIEISTEKLVDFSSSGQEDLSDKLDELGIDGNDQKVMTSNKPLNLESIQQSLLLKSSTEQEEWCGDADSDSSLTEGPDSERSFSPASLSDISSICDVLSLTETAESIVESRNLMFPTNGLPLESSAHSKNSMSPSTSDTSIVTSPGVFSVNLGAMRSLRLFFSEDSASCGQLVIASRESQYKIFHFYNGGLDKLADILEEWNLFHSAKQQKWRHGSISPFSQQFRVVKPSIAEDVDVHPEEHLYHTLNNAQWKMFMNDEGQILDESNLKKTVFFGGIEPSLRREVWPFLLHYYPYESTFEQREHIRNEKYLQYQKIKKKRYRLAKDKAWELRFWRSVQNTVEKDVVRTDRSHSYYKGDNNSNVETLKEILLNYAVAHPHLGYTQGMSDLLSPILVELKNEADAYWCFVGLMQRTIFVSQPKDTDMDQQLVYLKELLRLMFPKFHDHLLKVDVTLGLLFVHRWILLCFKREFNEEDSLTIWERAGLTYRPTTFTFSLL
ncbi:TBC1D16 [Bugula neritina]|uniref:TBC1D16 n=1 Tax=Bugula neritina TaxID=10212 RepID=A0A7J7KMK8_BUGNE|nr:TBC1D16 [Bugula neritina]